MIRKFYSTVVFLGIILSLLFVTSTGFACDGDKKKKSSDETSQESQKNQNKTTDLAGYEKVPPVGSTAVCPVTKEKFTVTKDSARSVHKGKTYVFCCSGCKPMFDKNPDRYI